MYEYKQCTDGLLCQGNILCFIYLLGIDVR